MHPITFQLKNIVSASILQGYSQYYIRAQVKERLQDYVLEYIYTHKEYKDLVFYGGTALRKLFNLDRLSEDLDFSNPKQINTNNLGSDINKYFKQTLQFTKLSVHTQGKDLVQRHTLKFELLHDIGLSNNVNEKIHIKVEIAIGSTDKFDINLTPYTTPRTSILINHYPIEVLMAGKMAAALTRVYKKGKTNILVKGRDFYDMIWYMQKGIIPDKNVIKSLLKVDSATAFKMLDEKVGKIGYKDLYSDLEHFFGNKSYIKDWCLNFQDFYKRYRENY